jgi:integrase
MPRKPGKLTKSQIDRLEPDPDREFFAWCTDPRRFGVRVSPTGRKTFLIQYGFEGRTRRYAIGQFGQITVEQARARAKELFAEIAKGSDPSRDRRIRKSAPTVSELADRYLDEHARLHKRPASVRADEGNIERHVKPRLGNVRVSDLSRQELADFHRALRKTPVAANRCLALLGKMLACAQLWGIRDDNPARGVPKYREKRRDRFLTEAEFAALGAALRVAEAQNTEDRFVIAAFRLLAVSGLRRGEIVSLRWRDVDLKRRRLTLRDAKTGDRVAIMNPAMQSIFEALRANREKALAVRRKPSRKPREASFYVLPGRTHGQPLSGLDRPWGRICGEAELEDVRIHDLRHSFASFAAAGGLSLPAIGALLGHKSAQTTQRYVDWTETPLERASDQVATSIASAMEADPEDVAPAIPLRR